MKKFINLTLTIILFLSTHANAGLVSVAYSGFFDESSISSQDGLPAGDYDTIGGLNDVALFELVAGTNEFVGSIFSPNDPADVFLIEVGANLRLIGATISWGTNLPGLELNFPTVPPGFLQQNTFFDAAPDWFFEESSITPEIFTIENLEAGKVGSTFDVAPSFYTASEFSRGQGIYSSLLSASGTCAQSYRQVPVGGQIGLESFCVEGIDYKMTFNVEQIDSPPSPVPEPSTLAIFALSIMGLALRRFKK